MSLLRYEENGQPSYEQVHKATLTLLGMLGMSYPSKTRLPIFKLYRKLQRDFPTETESLEARKLLDRLVQLRGRGLEPKHANGVYL